MATKQDSIFADLTFDQTWSKTRECRQCGARWDRSLPVCPTDGTSLLIPADSDPAFKSYQFYCMIGSGGMGVVYKARHLAMDKFVAIKMVHNHVLSPQAVRRIQVEGKAAGMLEHPYIVKAHDLGVSPSGPYIIMDYVEGQTLAEVLAKDGPLCLERSLKIFIDACDALAHAHSRGILHRDLKPSNIMLTGNSHQQEEIRILDFGIAKLVDQSTQSTHVTRTGELIGSPSYMSPEQAQAKDIDLRSDLYSLGCVMYETLTGSPPFASNSALEQLLMHINDTPISMTQAMLGTKRFDPDLEAIVSRLLQKNPALRYQSMDELKTSLMALRDGQQVPRYVCASQNAKRDSGIWKLSAVLLLAVGVLAGLIACVLLSSSQGLRTPDSKIRLDMPGESPDLSETMEDLVMNKRRHIDLRLLNSGLTDDDLRPLQNATDAENIVLKGAIDITADGLKYLSTLPVRRLELTACRGIKDLSPLDRMPKLEELILKQDTIGDNELVALEKLHLRKLDLGETNVHNLTALRNMHSLEELILPSTRITPQAMATIGQLKNLRVLQLAGTPIHDSDLRSIVPLRNLTKVTLTGCPNLTEAALKKLKTDLPDDCLLELNSDLPEISLVASSDTTRHDTAGIIEVQRAVNLQANHHEEESLVHMIRAISLLEHEQPKDQARIADCQNVLSTLLLGKKDYAGALKYALKSTAKYEKDPQSRETYKRLSTTYNTAATALEHLDRRREAIDYHQRSEDADRKLGDPSYLIENRVTQ